MRLLAITAVALAASLAACTGTAMHTPQEDGEIFTSETVLQKGDPILPLVVKIEPGSQVYQNPMLAIEVIEILADGEPVIGQPPNALFLGLDTKSQTVTTDHYVYKVWLELMIFGDLTPNGEGELIAYSIPADVKSLEITYRFVRYDHVPDEQLYKLKTSFIM